MGFGLRVRLRLGFRVRLRVRARARVRVTVSPSLYAVCWKLVSNMLGAKVGGAPPLGCLPFGVLGCPPLGAAPPSPPRLPTRSSPSAPDSRASDGLGRVQLRDTAWASVKAC